jgi:uncharacterized membrane protein YtjA (UPF0391 family)
MAACLVLAEIAAASPEVAKFLFFLVVMGMIFSLSAGEEEASAE